MNNEINNDVSKSRGEYLYDRKWKFGKYFGISLLIFIVSFIIKAILILVFNIGNIYIDVIFIIIVSGSAIIGIPSLILLLIYGFMASSYCPYCYTKGYKKNLINKKKIRSYTKRVKGSDLNIRFQKDYDGDKIYNILVEDWEFIYKHDCCGYEYTETKQLHIRTDNGKEFWE